MILNFDFKGVKTKINIDQNEKMKVAIEELSKQIDIDINSLVLLSEGKTITKSDFDRPIKEIFTSPNKNTFEILVYDNSLVKVTQPPESERGLMKGNNRIINIVFHFKLDPQEYEFPLDAKIHDIIETFSNKNGLNSGSLNFIYKNQKLDSLKTLEEIVSINDKDKKKMEIKVEEKKIINSEKNNNQINDETCFKKNRKKIFITIIASLILVILLMIILLVKFNKKKKTDKKELTEIFDETKCDRDKCLECDNSTIIWKCLICKEDFDLFNDECIKYAFSTSYKTKNSNTLVNIFNQNKIIFYIQIQNLILVALKIIKFIFTFIKILIFLYLIFLKISQNS